MVFVRQFRTAFISRGIGVIVIPDDCLEDCQGKVVTRFLGETDAIEGLPEDTLTSGRMVSLPEFDV